MAYFLNIDRFGNEIEGAKPLDVNLTVIGYIPSATGNTSNLNSVVVDPNGDIWIIDYQGDAKKINVAPQLDVLTTVQPRPTATGNTTNLNTAFKDASGNTWIVDNNGDAILCGAAPFKNLNEFHVDPNGSDVTGDGSQEKPFQTIAKAVSVATQGDQVIVHAGVYNENITLSNPNVALVGAQSEYGALTQINGNVTITATGTSVKIADISVNGVSHTGSAPLYLDHVTVNTTLSSSSSGYLEVKNSSVQQGDISKSAGTGLIENSKIDNVNITGTNTAVTIRNSFQDANSTISYGAGTIYGILNVQGGEISINASAIALETAALAQGLSGEMAKEFETSDFQKLGMLRPDLEASPTKVVTWDEVSGRLEVSDLSSFTGDTYKTNSTTCQNIVSTGNITLTVAPGLAYTPLQDIIAYADANNHMHGEVVSYDAITGVLVMNVHQKTGSGNFCNWVVNLDGVNISELSVSFGTSAPSSAGVEGDEYFITSDGTSAGVITASYIYDATSSSWILRPAGSTANWSDETADPSATGNSGTLPRFVNNTANGSKWYIDSTGKAFLIEKGLIITSMLPQHQNVSGTWASAQANSLSNVADDILVSVNGNSERVKYGKYTFVGHGYTPGSNLYLSKSLAGTITQTQPVDGDVHQKLGFVHDANTIEIFVQEAFIQGSTASTTNANTGITSSLVGRGTDVQLDDIKVRVSATGNVNMQVSLVSGTAQLLGTGVTMQSANVVNTVQLNVNATPVAVQAATAFSVAGAVQTFTFTNVASGKSYRATLIIGSSFLSNQLTLERI